MSEEQALNDRQHAVEFQKTLEAWRILRLASHTSLHIWRGLSRPMTRRTGPEPFTEADAKYLQPGG